MYFDFVFWHLGFRKGWRIYIININDADYGIRDTSGHATHRNHLSGDTYKSICWSRKIPTLKDAKNIARIWADTTSIYIQYGGNFDTIAQDLLRK